MRRQSFVAFATVFLTILVLGCLGVSRPNPCATCLTDNPCAIPRCDSTTNFTCVLENISGGRPGCSGLLLDQCKSLSCSGGTCVSSSISHCCGNEICEKQVGEDPVTCGSDCPPAESPVINKTVLERETFDFVNQERLKAGLTALKWNEEVAVVARAHSAYLAGRSNFTAMYISHRDADGGLQSDRLEGAHIYYFNLSGENIFATSTILTYYIKGQYGEIDPETCTRTEETISCFLGFNEGDVLPTEYKNQSALAAEATDGWMNSPGHRANILTAEFDESGMGAAANRAGNVYILTQVFITRAECGYRLGRCCELPGYYPYCYIPLECVSGVCR